MSERVLAVAAGLADSLEASLRDLLPDGTRAALINYPNHHNAGDPALYLGTLRVLRRLGVSVTYRCQHDTYSSQTLAGQLAKHTSVILINGGGNLGDQYPQQTARERVLADFPDVPTVQLPQSIWFAEDARRDAFGQLAQRHRALRILVRDEASLAIARDVWGTNARLLPDLAFGLRRIQPPRSPETGVVWLRRRDRESVASWAAAPTTGPTPIDWLDATPEQALGDRLGVALLGANRRLGARIARNPSLWRALSRTFEPLAERRVRYGCGLLARGRVVVTDRLHGVILSTLMGIPVVAVDTVNRKLSDFVASWPDLAAIVPVAADHGSALAMAEAMAAAAE